MVATAGVLGVLSDIGIRREINEDSAVAMELRIGPSSDGESMFLLAVADGMGGHSAGEIASRLAIETLVGTIASKLASLSNVDFDPVKLLDYGFLVANQVIYQQGKASLKSRGMGTTLTAAIVYRDRLYVGHVGDSRAYLVGVSGYRQLSRDHSVVQEKVDAGILTPEEACLSEERNQLRRALGIRESVMCDILTEDLRVDDVVILSTDGLHNSIHINEIARVALETGDPQVICGRLVNQARTRDGSDNITAVCIAVVGQPVGFRNVENPDYPARRGSRKLLAGLLLAVSIGIVLILAQIFRTGRSTSLPVRKPVVEVRQQKVWHNESHPKPHSRRTRSGSNRRQAINRRTTSREEYPAGHAQGGRVRSTQAAPGGDPAVQGKPPSLPQDPQKPGTVASQSKEGMKVKSSIPGSKDAGAQVENSNEIKNGGVLSVHLEEPKLSGVSASGNGTASKLPAKGKGTP